MTKPNPHIAPPSQEHVKAEQLDAKPSLRSSVAYEIEQLALQIVRGVARAGKTKLVILPEEPALEIEALVFNKDMGFVRERQLAAVKLDAFPFTRYGFLEGEVVTVGQHSVPHERLAPVYPVRVRVKPNDIQVDGREVRLSSGMSTSVGMRTGERRIVDFSQSPLG